MFATISRHKTIRRELRLPVRGEVLVAAHDSVETGQVIARATQYGRLQILDIAAALGVRDEDLLARLLAGVGDPVESGEVIAERKRRLFGRRYRSPVTGRIAAILNGRLLVETEPQIVELVACPGGRVVHVIAGFGAIIESEGILVEGAWGVGNDSIGTVKVLAEAPDDRLTAERIDATAQGCILVGGQSADEAALAKAGQQSVRGIVIGSVPSALIGRMASLPFPMMLTEGFGTIPMASPILEILREAEGQEACLSTGTEARGSAARPQLIVAARATGGPSQPGSQLTEGATVRIVREPHIGKVGRIKSVSDRPVESGAQQPIALVEFGPGEIVAVPLRNTEPIG